jgi:hypothetical protein
MYGHATGLSHVTYCQIFNFSHLPVRVRMTHITMVPLYLVCLTGWAHQTTRRSPKIARMDVFIVEYNHVAVTTAIK